MKYYIITNDDKVHEIRAENYVQAVASMESPINAVVNTYERLDSTQSIKEAISKYNRLCELARLSDYKIKKILFSPTVLYAEE